MTTTTTDETADTAKAALERTRRRTLDRLYRCLSLVVGSVARDWEHCGKAACRRARCCRGQICETQVCETQIRAPGNGSSPPARRAPLSPGASQGRIGPIGFALKQSSGRTR